MKRMRWFGGTALLLICLPALAQAFPMQWSAAEGGNDNWYFIIVGEATWEEADVWASTLYWRGLQGHLATITSQAEQDWLYQTYFVTIGVAGAVNIGAYQINGSAEPDGGWSWVTDEEWDYTNWHADEPNDDPESASYAAMVADGELWYGEWDDHDGSPIEYHLIEFEDAVIGTESTTLSALKALYR
jgi:hypothetical protein